MEQLLPFLGYIFRNEEFRYLKVRVYKNYNLMNLQGLDKDGFEGGEISKKFNVLCNII